ncbi:MAG: hypothetical protein IPF82_17005 [Blastocatellia bacterium]|nr:hypothetical protein [Blastocatellia bacterium]
MPIEKVPDIALVTAVSTWRETQGVYRFDRDVLDALWHTPVSGDLPTEVLERLPEWCVYVENAGSRDWPSSGRGFYAHLESDSNTGRRELRLLVDLESGDLVGVPLHLGGDLRQAIDAMIAEGDRQLRKAGLLDGILDVVGRREEILSVEPLVSLVLSPLLGGGRDLGPKGPSRHPPYRVARALATPNAPTVWETGTRLGGALRRAREAASDPGGGSHAAPRPHIRRAHWHHFWTGPKAGERRLVLRWVHLTLVGGDDDGLVPTIRPVGL